MFKQKNSSFCLDYLLLAISAIIIFYFTKSIFKYYCVNSESLFMPYISCEELPLNSFFHIYTTNDHSWFILSIFHVLINRYLPLAVNMHPQMCMQNITVYFLILLFVFFIFSLAFNITKYSKIKYINALTSLLIMPIVFYIMYESVFLYCFVSNDCWFLAYIFQSIFPILLFQYGEYFYVTQQKINKRTLTIITALLICSGMCHEFFRFIIITSPPIIFIAEMFLNKSNLNIKKSILIYFGIIFANIWICFTQTFRKYFSYNHQKYSVSEFIEYLPDYIQNFLNFIHQQLWLFLILFCITFLIIYFCKKDKAQNIRFLIVIYSIVAASILFEFALIFVQNNTVSFNHIGIAFLFKINILNAIISAIGYLFANSENLINKKSFLLIFFTIIFLIEVCLINNTNIHFAVENAKNIKINMYILEKFYLLNRKNSNTIYNYYSDATFHNKFIKYIDNFYKKPHTNTPPPQIKEVCKEHDGQIICREKMLKIVKEKTGYEFSDEELKKLDFSKLYELQ